MEKQEVLLEVLRYLKKSPNSNSDAIKNHIESILEEQGKIGLITTGSSVRTTNRVYMSKDDKLLIHVVIWDLITERILTPFAEHSGDILAHLVVTDMQSLESKLKELE